MYVYIDTDNVAKTKQRKLCPETKQKKNENKVTHFSPFCVNLILSSSWAKQITHGYGHGASRSLMVSSPPHQTYGFLFRLVRFTQPTGQS